jgi:hypothetical protein
MSESKLVAGGRTRLRVFHPDLYHHPNYPRGKRGTPLK